jgi:hypothetical protein
MFLLDVAGHGRRLYLGEMTGRLVVAQLLIEIMTEDLITNHCCSFNQIMAAAAFAA